MKKILLTLVIALTLVLALTVAASAATYYVDAEGNVSTEKTEDTVYHFEPGSDRTIDKNKCFRITTVYLYDTSTTKLVFPVASEVKSGYMGVSPHAGWNASLKVYALDESGAVITEITEDGEAVNKSYATQISEIEFLSGVDFDGAYSSGAFSGFSALKKLTFHGNISCGRDAVNKGGFFTGTQIEEINIYGSGNVNLTCFRHLSSQRSVTITFHEGCTSSVVTRYSNGCYMLPSNNLSNWTIVINPEMTFASQVAEADGVTMIPALYSKEVSGLTLIVAATNKNAYEGTDLTTSHGLYYTTTSEAPITAEVKTYCELYGGHGEVSNVSPCAEQCGKCLEYIALEDPTHALSVVMEYLNGYLASGAKSSVCTNLGCSYSENNVEIPSLFTSKGYSRDEGSNAVVLVFNVNNEAIKAYESYLGTKISYGVVATLALDKYEGSPLNSDASAKDGAVSLSFDETDFTILQLKLTGIDKKDEALYCCGYIAFDGNVSYINGDKIASTALKISYNNYTGIPENE